MLNRYLVLVMALLAVVAIAGCGGSSDTAERTVDAASEQPSGTSGPAGGSVIDAGKTAARIKAEIQAALGETVKAVECPDDQEVDPAARFKCSVTFPDGKEATATLKILNPKADVRIVGLKPAN